MKIYGTPRFNIVIPTWNSMPELKKCLEAIKIAIPYSHIHKIIIIDRHSTDGTVKCANEYGCTVLYDDVSLGSARLAAINYSIGEDILFIDSDIIISPEWYDNMRHIWDNNKDIGMLYGRTVDSGKYGKIKTDKIKRDFKYHNMRMLKQGDRGYTHNTFIRVGILGDIQGLQEVNSWEDYIITQHILGKGLLVAEVPYTVIHQHGNVCSAKVGWCIRGMIDTGQPLIHIFGTHFYYIFEGIRSFIHNKDIDFLRWGILNFMDGFNGYFKHKFSRDKT